MLRYEDPEKKKERIVRIPLGERELTIGLGPPTSQFINNKYSKAYKNPQIPKGYKYIYGKWDNGFVIERISDGSQFVWIPVGMLKANGTLDNFLFDEKFGRRNYRNDEFSEEGYREPLSEELSQQIGSVKKYGGFYISRYYISKSGEGKPQSVKGTMPWVNIDFIQARRIAAMQEDSETIKTHLIYGAEYDSVLQWIIESKAKTFEEVAKDSTSWCKHLKPEDKSTILKPINLHEKIFANGSFGDNYINNIYFAGNLNEWTQEHREPGQRVIRGTEYSPKGHGHPIAAARTSNVPYASTGFMGFRTAIWLK